MPETPAIRTDGPIHEHFGLTYANYLVLHRTLMQSMPVEWQNRMVRCLNELDAAFDHVDKPNAYKVVPGEERYLSELTDQQIRAAGCDVEHGEEFSTYYDDRFTELGEGEASVYRVIMPTSDPLPHYRRGYVEPNEDAIAALPRVPEPTPARVFSNPLTPPPDDLRRVRDCHGDVWRRLPNEQWHTPDTIPRGWPYMVKKWAPLVEVIAPPEVSR